jgi:hypothetical protein
LDDIRDGMMFAAIALATAAAMRPSELLGSQTYPERALRADQITFYTALHASVTPSSSVQHSLKYCIVRLDISKTHPRGEERTVSAMDAVQAVWQWMVISGHQGSTVLFQHADTPLSISMLIGHLRRKLTEIGLKHLHVTGKCFRKGAASTLSALGTDAADIAIAGGWSVGSNVWQSNYANFPAVKRARAIQVNAQMQQAMSVGTSIGVNSL